jgi:N-acetylglucosaminyldiphosphoundecaprenol N-acetyl-beta-D-mannosaminyltransferase
VTSAVDRLASVPRRSVGPVSFSVLTLPDAIALVHDLAREPLERGVAVHFGNAYTVALADADPDYRALVGRADLVCSDGTPVVWAGRRCHGEVAEQWSRVYGPDVMSGVLAASDPQGPRHYLVGATEATLGSLLRRISERWPRALIVGAESPPFRPESQVERDARIRRIRESRATTVWVGLGTPKQDAEVRRLVDALPVTALGVGAAFDFLAGTVPQAPPWMQRAGLEWTHRWAREPRRLTRRYLWGNPRFMVSVARHWSANARSGNG